MGDNFVSRAPILVTFHFCDQEYFAHKSIIFSPHVNCIVTLSQKVSNMGIMLNVTILTINVTIQLKYGWKHFKRFNAKIISTEKQKE